MSTLLKALPSLSVILVASVLAVVPGCGMGEPECSCSVDRVEFPVVRSVEDTLTATFTVRNSGDADRLAFTIPEFDRVGLTIDEPRVYVLDEGATAEYTLRYAPQDSVTAEEILLRVGPGDDCVIRVDLRGAGSPRPIGACCFGDGSCEQGLIESECVDAGGRFNGVGTTCDDAVCVGACCLLTGDCAQDTVTADGITTIQPVTSDACATLGGTYRGDGTVCASTVCPQPTPACVIPQTSIDLVFSVDDLVNGRAKSDTLVVRNTGLATLHGSPPFALCSGSVTFTALTNAGEAPNFFSVSPGDSALVEVTVSPATFSCEAVFDTNADPDFLCAPVSISATLQFETFRRARRN